MIGEFIKNWKDRVTNNRNQGRNIVNQKGGIQSKMTMLKTQVNSSLIKAVAYDNGTLTIDFTTGKSYSYHNVPENKVQELIKADSPGRYFNREIRDQYS